MNVPECYYRVSAKALILNDKKQFMLFKEQDGIWDLPGGGLEFNEDPVDALKREIKEESGLSIISVSQNPSYFISGQRDGYSTYLVNILYSVSLKDFNFTPSQECIEIGFFDKNSIKNVKVFSAVIKFANIYDKSRH